MLSAKPNLFETITRLGDGYQTGIRHFSQATSGSDDLSPESALEALQAASEEFSELLRIEPTVPHYADWLAACELEIGKVLTRLGDSESANVYFGRSAKRRDTGILAKWTGKQSVRETYELGKELRRLGQACGSNKLHQGLDYYKQSVECFQKLLDLSPSIEGYIDHLAASEAGVAKILDLLGHVQDSLEWRARSNERRRDLKQQRWREPITAVKLANGLYEMAEVDKKAGSAFSRRVDALVKCCDSYSEGMTQGYGTDFLPRFLSAASELATIQNGKKDQAKTLGCVENALRIANKSHPDWNVEIAADYAEYIRAKGRGILLMLVRFYVSSVPFAIAAMLPLVLVLLGVAGSVLSPLLQVFLLCLCSEWRRNNLRNRRVAAIAVSIPGFVGAYAVGSAPNCVILLATQLVAMMTLIYFKELQERFALFYRTSSLLARIGRRTDCAAEDLAYWILNNVPRVLQPIFLRAHGRNQKPELRRCWRWAVCGFVSGDEFRLLVLSLVESIDQFLSLPLLLPGSRRPRPHRSPGASWAVGLRRAIHSPRGDGVPLCA